MSSAVRSNSAKRSASGNLSNSSDDEQDDQLRGLSSNNTSSASSCNTAASDLDTTASSLDCSDNPCSPGASSSCSGSSGPVYIRPPGFKFYAQEVTRPRLKKKKKTFSVNNGKSPTISQPPQQNTAFKKRDATPPKHRQMKRDPLPMRLRAFPQSFWQQPNQPVDISPAHCHKVLPPLTLKDEIDMVRPVTPPEEPKQTDNYHHTKDKQQTMTTNSNNSASGSNGKPSRQLDRKIIVTGNPESSLTKLFEDVDEKTNPKKIDSSSSTANYKIPVPPSNSVRRARPKNSLSMNKTMLHGADPYMVDTIADKLFPHLTLEKAGVKSCHATAGGGTSIQLITLKEGDKSVTLPSLAVEQNYSQMLSELVPYL